MLSDVIFLVEDRRFYAHRISCLVLQIPSVQHLMVEKSKSYYKILGLCVLCQTNALREYEPLRLVWICVYGGTPISRQLRALDYAQPQVLRLGTRWSETPTCGGASSE